MNDADREHWSVCLGTTILTQGFGVWVEGHETLPVENTRLGAWVQGLICRVGARDFGVWV